ncbi:golgin subfamily A member 6-like protein 22 isoform X2 [Branchiostoma lanceolatum]|uniref:golgin subfamily A member 6-like protein 22 isoform X2 n=1 Tax=Branchiostoma lanceolatum TaxID=7740 RepID=UPI0034518BCE
MTDSSHTSDSEGHMSGWSLMDDDEDDMLSLSTSQNGSASEFVAMDTFSEGEEAKEEEDTSPQPPESPPTIEEPVPEDASPTENVTSTNDAAPTDNVSPAEDVAPTEGASASEDQKTPVQKILLREGKRLTRGDSGIVQDDDAVEQWDDPPIMSLEPTSEESPRPVTTDTDSDFVTIDPNAVEDLDRHDDGQTLTPTSLPNGFLKGFSCLDGVCGDKNKQAAEVDTNANETESVATDGDDSDFTARPVELPRRKHRTSEREDRRKDDSWNLTMILNWTILLALIISISIAIGDALGSSRESHLAAQLKNRQVKRLKLMQDELLSCLYKLDDSTDLVQQMTKKSHVALLDQLGEDLVRLRNQLNDSRQRSQKWKVQVTSLETENEDLKTKLASEEQASEETNQALVELQGQIEALESERSDLAGKITSLETETEEAKQQAVENTQSKDAQNTQLRNRLTEATLENAELKQKMADLVSQLEEQQKAEQEQEESLQERILALQNKMVNLEQQLNVERTQSNRWQELYTSQQEKQKDPRNGTGPDFFSCIHAFIPSINVSDYTENFGEDAFLNLTEALRQQFEQLKNHTESANFSTYTEQVKSAIKALKDTVADTITTVTSEEFAEATKATVEGVGETLKDTLETVHSYSQEFLNSEDDDIGSMKKSMKDSLKKAKKTVTENLKKASKTVRENLKDVKLSVKESWKQMRQVLNKGVKETRGWWRQKEKQRQREDHRGQDEEVRAPPPVQPESPDPVCSYAGQQPVPSHCDEVLEQEKTRKTEVKTTPPTTISEVKQVKVTRKQAPEEEPATSTARQATVQKKEEVEEKKKEKVAEKMGPHLPRRKAEDADRREEGPPRRGRRHRKDEPDGDPEDDGGNDRPRRFRRKRDEEDDSASAGPRPRRRGRGDPDGDGDDSGVEVDVEGRHRAGPRVGRRRDDDDDDSDDKKGRKSRGHGKDDDDDDDNIHDFDKYRLRLRGILAKICQHDDDKKECWADFLDDYEDGDWDEDDDWDHVDRDVIKEFERIHSQMKHHRKLEKARGKTGSQDRPQAHTEHSPKHKGGKKGKNGRPGKKCKGRKCQDAHADWVFKRAEQRQLERGKPDNWFLHRGTGREEERYGKTTFPLYDNLSKRARSREKQRTKG